jgi:archaellum component FlaC
VDIVLFCFGALGALLTVYIGKQEIVPEFRPLFDTSEKEKEAIRHRNHIKLTEQHIDTIQARIEDPSTSDNDATKLQIVLETSLKELQAARERLQILEHEIKQSQVISRALGFLFYIVLGGIFGSLLAGQVKIEGLSNDLSIYLQSMVIGATWITYLSIIGLNQIKKKVNEEIETLRKEIQQIVETTVSQTEERSKQPNSIPSSQLTQIYELLDEARTSIFLDRQSQLDVTPLKT